MPLILGTNSIKDTGYDVANSLMFSSDHYLTKSFSSAGNRQSWTWSAWIKRSKQYNGTNTNANRQVWFGGYTASNDTQWLEFGTQGDIFYYTTNSLSATGTRLMRDLSAWFHAVVVYNGSNIKFYHNNVLDCTLSLSGDRGINVGGTHTIGALATNQSSRRFEGYMTEVCFIDGSQLDPDQFGEFDEDSPTIWKPKDVSGLTFGNNGFYLDFENASSLGADVSGNSNNFTVNNLTSIDQSTDTCTNNFCTMNPLDNQIQSSTFSDGNLSLTSGGSGIETYNTSTFGLSSGKWYMELKHTGGNNVLRQLIGITQNPTDDDGQYLGGDNNDSWGYYDNVGNIAHNASTVVSYDTWTTNDIIGLALDLDNSRLYFSKNGTFQNSSNPADGTNPITIDSGFTYFIAWGDLSVGNMNASFNFGSPPYSISSGNSDANGHGNFEYSVPSGYFAICSKNLAEFG